MIKTIIFDIGGVISYTNFSALYSGFARRIGIPDEFIINYHRERKPELTDGTILLEQFWQHMIAEGANPDVDYKEIFIEEGIKNRELNHELLKIIQDLRRNYSVGTLTNLTHGRRILDERMGLYTLFDFAILSCQEKMKKPDPEIYKLCLKAANVKPEEAIFIDDKEEYVHEAKKVGINGIVYSYPNNDKLLDDLKNLGVNI